MEEIFTAVWEMQPIRGKERGMPEENVKLFGRSFTFYEMTMFYDISDIILEQKFKGYKS